MTARTPGSGGARRRSKASATGAGNRIPSMVTPGTALLGRWLLLLSALLIGIGLFLVGLYVGLDMRVPPGAADTADRLHQGPGRVVGDLVAGGSEAPTDLALAAPSATGDGALVALVIDDLGRELDDLEALAALGVPVTYSVLPFETRTAEVVEALTERRVEFLCHLPMQASNDADPGPGALMVGMTETQLRHGVAQALAAVPGAVGVNNHMGSELSADLQAMTDILTAIGRRGLFFLDSRTSAHSVGYDVAVALGLPAAKRDVFLDRDPDAGTVRLQFRRLLDRAAAEGSAIAIGHPYDSTLEVLRSEVPRATALGYRFVVVSRLLERHNGSD